MALSLALGVLTATATSRLHVKLLGHRQHVLIVFNGQQFASAENIMSVRGLAPGNYPIKVLRPGYWDGYRAIFRGVIHVPQHSLVKATITPNGMKVLTEPLAHGHGSSYWDTDHGHGSVHPDPYGNGGFVSLDQQTCSPVVLGMSPDVFTHVLDRVRQQRFDEDRMRVAKRAVLAHGATSLQVAQIMRLLSFESNRLKTAKFCYGIVADPDSYYQVTDELRFSSSVRELDRFIDRH